MAGRRSSEAGDPVVEPEPAAPGTARRGLLGALALLPEGTMAVGVGLAVTGIASYCYLVVAARTLELAEFGRLSVLWSLVFLAGGTFLPFEQEVSRRLVGRRVAGVGGRPVVVGAIKVGSALVAVLALLALVASPVLADRLFSGDRFMVACLGLGMAGYWVANLSEGVLSGNGRFARYGAYLGVEASLRLFVCVACAVIGVTTAGPIGLALGIAPVVTAIVLLWGRRELVEPGPPLPLREFAGGLGALLTGALLAQALINASPVLVQLLAGPDGAAQTAVFTTALLVARVPLFLFQAVQAALLPKLSGMAARNEFAAFTTLVKRLVVIVAALIAVGASVAFALGPVVIELVFKYQVERRTVTLLAIGSGGYITATAMALGIIALGGAKRVVVGWAAGVVTLIVVVMFGTDPLLRVETAFASSTIVATVIMALVLRAQLRSGAKLEQGPLLDALNDISFEP